MSGYNVEVRTGILTGDHNIHTWLHITGPDGSTEAWGFYPATDSAGNMLYGPGDVRPEDPDSASTATSGPISMTEAQYQSLMSNIASMDAAPPDYSVLSLPGGTQCSMWAVDALQDIGLIPEAISPDTTPEFIPLLDSLIWNPLGQSIGFGIYDRVNDWFDNAFFWAPRVDPLTLDLDGDGLETVGIDTARPVHFDHNADGVQTATGWVAPDDGFLVLDRNGNEVVDSGAELFGDSTVLADGSNAADGFAALAEQDTNGDGTVDAQDAAWSDLRIWRDLNQNGVSEDGELQSLEEIGIASLDVEAQSHRQTLSNGNRIADLGRFTWATGESGEIESVVGRSGDIDLAANPFYREFTESVPLTNESQALPAMRGSGTLRDMREAASLSPEFAQALSNYNQATTRDAQLAQLDGLIRRWASTSSQPTSIESARSAGFNLIYLAPGMSAGDYENHLSYMGSAILSPGDQGDAPSITDLSDEDRAHLAELEADQEQITAWMGVLERFNGTPFVEIEESTTSVVLGSGRRASVGTSPGIVGVKRAYVSISSAQKEMLDQSYSSIRQSVYDGLIMQTRLAPYLQAVTLGYDDATDSFGMDFAGLDAQLSDAAANDPINALIDLIELNRYAGDSLQQMGWDAEGELRSRVSELKLDPALSDQVEQALYDLNVVMGSGELEGSASRDTLLGDEQDDRLYGHGDIDQLSGGAGDDRLFGDAGNDELRGGIGDDRLDGGRGDDILDGGAGSDRLDGGYGSDTYRFGFGSGHDYIASFDRTAGKLDVVEFGEGVTTDDVTLTRSNDDLVITLGDGTDRLKVHNYFGYDGDNQRWRVEELRFADGAVWDVEDVKQAVLMSGASDETLIGYDTDDVIDGGDGNDRIQGHDGNDDLSGGAGSDYLYGNDGDDVLSGGAGNDYLDGGKGNDVYRFDAGFGKDRIYSYDTTAGKTDAVEFGANVAPADVTATRVGGNLVLSLANGSDELTVSNFFHGDANSEGYRVEEIRFTDGSVWTVDDIKQKVLVSSEDGETLTGYATDSVLDGAGGDDTIYGRGGDDDLSGGSGDDRLDGDSGADLLRGGTGYDRLSGGDGDDILDGGAGNDWLSGDAGNDVYRFGHGDGHDTVRNYSYEPDSAKVDAVRFDSGIAPSDVTLSRSGNDLTIELGDGADSLEIDNYFWGDALTGKYRVEELRFDDGTVWSVDDVKQRTLVTGAGDDQVIAYDTDDVLDGMAGADSIHGRGGDDTLLGSTGADRLYGQEGNDTLDGGADADVLEGGNGTDTLLGGTGDDELRGDGGNDVLDGGAGNDLLDGGYGSDVYRFGFGSGQDRIDEYTYNPASIKVDAVEFAADVMPADATLRRSGRDLVVAIGDGADTLTVDNYFWNDANSGEQRIEELRFADGTVWDVEHVKQQVLLGTEAGETLTGYDVADVIEGLGGDDDISGHDGDDALAGGAGDDRLDGDNGADQLSGGSGHDRLYGGNGDDVLVGGSEADRLDGGSGSDVYRFGFGDGQDRIVGYDNDPDPVKVDAIEFESGVAVSDITLRRSGQDLVVSLGDGTDNLTVDNYFWNDANSGEYRVEELRFDDGTVWDVDHVKQQVLVGTEASETLIGYDVADTIDGLAGNDTIHGHAGNDTLRGGDGADVLRGDEGDDSVLGGVGNDRLYGDAGDDVLQGGAGDDDLHGGAGADSLSGDVGDDMLLGGDGDDQLNGGQGDDRLEGGAGNDTYVFDAGHGNDSIIATDDTAGRQEVVEFTSGVAPEDVLARRRGDDLLLANVNGTDRITVEGHFRDETQNDSTIQSVRFSDGTVWSLADLNDRVLQGSAGDDVLEGHLASDSITGGAGEDTLFAREGDDTLRGGAGSDSLHGEDGDDTLIGGTGADYLEGGSGDDLYQMAAADAGDQILDSEGNDRLRFTDLAPTDLLLRRDGSDLVLSMASTGVLVAHVLGQFSDQAGVPGTTAVESIEFSDGTVWDYDTIKGQAIAGTDADDVIEGHADADVIHAGGGDDAVTASAGDDEVHGGAGADTLDGQDGADSLYGDDGADTLNGGQGADHLYGGADDDNLHGDQGDDLLDGGTGDDTLYGGSGDDNLRGGDGADTLDGGTGVDRLEGGAGDDVLTGNGSLFGEAGNDTLEGTGLLSGGDGADTLTGHGADELLGGAGDDVLIANRDTWTSGPGSTLEGGVGDDTLYGSFADDTYRFDLGDGKDRLIERRDGEAYSNVSPSSDTLLFGAGIAVADLAFERHGDDLLVRHANGNDQITVERWFQEPTDHFKVNRFVFDDATELTDADVEAAVVTYGTASADTLLGYRSLDEQVFAGAGDDQVWGRAGDDTLHGEDGDDYLDGEAGDDHLLGGLGEDNLQGRDGDDVLDGGADGDSLSGGAGNDVLYGRAGADDLFGGAGSDQLDGGSGDDYFTGGNGDDVLIGGDGNDQLSGDAGDDQLTGGLGDDKYVYASGQGVDVIDNSHGGYDGLFFTDVGRDRLGFTRDGDDLLIRVDDDASQSVRVLNHFLGGDDAIDYVQPDGGYLLDTQQINDIVAAGSSSGDFDATVHGTDAGETLTGYDGADLVQGAGGDDTLWGLSGDDRLEGQAGNDTLYGGDGSGQGSGADQLFGGGGDDVLNGEDGDDLLVGGAGNDDYYYSANGGVDVIDNTGGGTDTVFFLGGIDRSRITFHQDGDDLVMLLDDDLTQQVRVTNHFLGGEAAISYVQPTDGGNAIAAGDIANQLVIFRRRLHQLIGRNGCCAASS